MGEHEIIQLGLELERRLREHQQQIASGNNSISVRRETVDNHYLTAEQEAHGTLPGTNVVDHSQADRQSPWKR